jgi:hypothetical protein
MNYILLMGFLVWIATIAGTLLAREIFNKK